MSATTDKARQVMEETSQERETRSEGDFPQAEKSLSQRLGTRFNIPLFDNISSYLGNQNPLAKDVNPKTECVWLLDNTAYRPIHPYPHSKQPYQAEFMAAYFKTNTGKDVSKAVAIIAERIGLAQQEVNQADVKKRIAHRLQPFVDTIAPARFVNVKFANGRVEKLGPGGRSAVSTQTIVALHDHKDGEAMEIRSSPAEIAPHGAMTTHFADEEGWLVVSGKNPLPIFIPLQIPGLIHPNRHRRFNQNNHDPLPHRHPQNNLRRRPSPHPRHARTLRSNRSAPPSDLVLPLRLPLQPLPLPSPLPPRPLPQRPYNPPRRLLDGS